MVSVPISFFPRNYDAVVLGKNGLLGVAGGNDTFHIVRIGDNVLPLENAIFTSAPNFSANSGSVLLDGKTWFKDQRTRFVGWEQLKSYPLIALVGMDEMDTLSAYREGRHSAIQYAAVATLALAILTAIAIAPNSPSSL